MASRSLSFFSRAIHTSRVALNEVPTPESLGFAVRNRQRVLPTLDIPQSARNNMNTEGSGVGRANATRDLKPRGEGKPREDRGDRGNSGDRRPRQESLVGEDKMGLPTDFFEGMEASQPIATSSRGSKRDGMNKRDAPRRNKGGQGAATSSGGFKRDGMNKRDAPRGDKGGQRAATSSGGFKRDGMNKRDAPRGDNGGQRAATSSPGFKRDGMDQRDAPRGNNGGADGKPDVRVTELDLAMAKEMRAMAAAESVQMRPRDTSIVGLFGRTSLISSPVHLELRSGPNGRRKNKDRKNKDRTTQDRKAELLRHFGSYAELVKPAPKSPQDIVGRAVYLASLNSTISQSREEVLSKTLNGFLG